MGVRLRKYCLLGVVIFVVVLFISFHRSSVNQESTASAIGEGDRRAEAVVAIARDAHARHVAELNTLNRNSSVDLDLNEYRRNFIRQMMRFAWDNYRYTSDYNGDKNASCHLPSNSDAMRGERMSCGQSALGATIVDALDTLYIMNLTDEFNDARDWVRLSFDMKSARNDLSVFETNIRFVGGLLSAYALTSDEVHTSEFVGISEFSDLSRAPGFQLFLTKAKEVADLLLPAFETPTGIPMALVNMRTGRVQNYGWASGGCSILSEYGSLELEFSYLSKATGNTTYADKTRRIRSMLDSLDKPDGLYPNYLNPRTGKFCIKHVSIGALGDSFYEYLFKLWLAGGKNDTALKETYDAAISAIEKHLLRQSQPNNLWYFAEMRGTRMEHKMDHLGCFIAGLFALQSKHEVDATRRSHYLELARQIAHTCHQSYIKTTTGIGPESFRFSEKVEAEGIRDNDLYYILRPEAIEGWMILYRVTGEQKYREWCWSAALAIERYCKVSGGYSGIRNVYSTGKVDHDDVQQSFFLAETLKYLYLAFDEPSHISLDDWVFNTEAHPLPMNFLVRDLNYSRFIPTSVPVFNS